MAIAQAAKQAFQVALAGTLEEKGFHRVSDTNYVIEGDGIEWRVVFGPEYSDAPGTFRDATGIYIPEIDRLYTALLPQERPLSEPLASTRYRGHKSTHIGHAYTLLNWQNGGDVSKTIDGIEPCHMPQQNSTSRLAHWHTVGHDPIALGRRIDGYWRRYVWPWLEGRMTLESVYEPWDLPPQSQLVGVHWATLVEWWVCGHHQQVIDRLKRLEAQCQLTDAEFYEKALNKIKADSRFPLLWRFRCPSRERILRMRDSDRRALDKVETFSKLVGVTF